MLIHELISIMQKVLILEPNESATQLIASHIVVDMEMEVLYLPSLDTVEHVVNEHAQEIVAIIVNIEYCAALTALSDNLPLIIITNGVPLSARTLFESKNVLDFVNDYTGHNVEYIIHLLKRVKHQNQIKILVADDELLHRNLICYLLTNNGFIVLDTKSVENAFKCIQDDPQIKMLILDSNLPKTGGITLINQLRQRYSKSELCIIVMVHEENTTQAVMALRSGANDCINKPFRIEEFHIRLMQNMQLMEAYEELRATAQRDFLTNLFNRRHFFDIAKKLYENYKRENIHILIAMLDIDHFKSINDTYGHAIGDIAIVKLANILIEHTRSTDIVARFGGEEFCILSTFSNATQGQEIYERIRQIVEQSTIQCEQGSFSYTISIGVTQQAGDNLEAMINEADLLLYKAKNSGRNKVVYE